MSSLAEINDGELYNRDIKKRVLDHYGDKIQFCPSYRVKAPLKYAFHHMLV